MVPLLFSCRQPEIALQTPESITKDSENVSERDIRKWFQDISEMLKEENVFKV